MADFIVSREDWSLHRKGHEDQERHQEKIKEVIRKKIKDLVTEENLIINNGEKKITIPIKELQQYKITYNYNKTKQVGMGDGSSQIGDTVATDNDSGQAPGEGNGAGDMSGEDYTYTETEIDLMDIQNIIFEDLELPDLEKKQAGIMETESYEFNDIRRIGITGNIDKKKSMLAAFKRNALKGNPGFYPIYPEDLRYKAWNEIKKPDTKAVIIAMMDTSGSMGIWEKYMSRSFFFWTKKFLETQYDSVEIVYIAHHTEAKIVNEYNFFHRGEAGGTICSSAYRKALQLINEKYPPSQYNIYLYHVSDGDNLTSDNHRCIKLVDELCNKINMVNYIEVNQYSRHSTLMNAYKYIKHDKFRHFVVCERKDIFYALKYFFRKGRVL
jgi:hypothetical protein